MPHRCHQDVSLFGDGGDVFGVGVADGDGSIFLEKHEGYRFPDHVASADDYRFLAVQRNVIVRKERHDGSRGAAKEAALAGSEAAGVDFCKAVHILVGMDEGDHLFFIDAFG